MGSHGKVAAVFAVVVAAAVAVVVMRFVSQTSGFVEGSEVEDHYCTWKNKIAFKYWEFLDTLKIILESLDTLKIIWTFGHAYISIFNAFLGYNLYFCRSN